MLTEIQQGRCGRAWARTRDPQIIFSREDDCQLAGDSYDRTKYIGSVINRMLVGAPGLEPGTPKL